MKMNNLFFTFILITLLLFSCNDKQKTNKVDFVPTIHHFHQTNSNYTYNMLKEHIKKFAPDIIAVEIRKEDIEQDSSYLKKYYPKEMYMMRYWFPETKIMGFDWLGDEIKGNLIPKNYFSETAKYTLLEKEMERDSAYFEKFRPLDEIVLKRLAIISNYNLDQLKYSRKNNEVTVKLHKLMDSLTVNTKYSYLANFYRKRDSMIIKNINNIIKNNKNKSVIILTGDDHYQMLKNKVNGYNPNKPQKSNK